MTHVVRRLTSREIALAQSVFGAAIDYRTVRLVAAAPFRFAVTLGPIILFPPGAPEDFAAADLRAQAWLIHELTHVWQFAAAPGRTLASWAKAVITGGYGPGLSAYRYSLPLGQFAHYGLEQQASIVEHAFVLREGGRPRFAPLGSTFAHHAGATPFPALSFSTLTPANAGAQT